MAPELRKRKATSEPVKAAPSKPGKAAIKGKRKAVEEASPVSTKKQKPIKAAPAPKSPAPRKTSGAKDAGLKPNGKKKIAEPVAEDVSNDADDNDEKEEEEIDNAALVLATEMDSSDGEVDESVTLFKEGQDVGTVPSVSKAVREFTSAASKASHGDRGVIYVGRIPHGFYEYEMRQYFSQFGPITRLRLSRNKKTGASKHFAFVEFAEQSTAEVVAKTMNNYLLFGHILKCQVVPKERVHEELFKGANCRFKKVPWNLMAGKMLEKPRSESAWQKRIERETARRAEKAKKLKALGYDYEGPEIKPVPAPGVPRAAAEEQTDGKVAETDAIEAAPAEESKMEEPKAEESKGEEPKEEELKTEEAKAKEPRARATKKGGKAKKAKSSK